MAHRTTLHRHIHHSADNGYIEQRMINVRITRITESNHPMTSEFLHDRERALEDSFFFQKDKELLGKLKQVSERNTEKSELKQASGISDDAVLEDLLDAGINAKTAASLSLVPLVLVAWADGVIQRQEREAQGDFVGDHLGRAA